MSADARVFDQHHTHHSNQVDRTVRELTSPVYIAVKFALGDGAGLMREFADAQNAFKGASPEAAAELGQCQATVGRSISHLEKNPPLFALQTCFQQPDKHPLFIATREFLAGHRHLEERLVAWPLKVQDFDPCQLEIKEHEGPVHAVAYFPERDEEETRVASASDDGTIKITSTVSGEVLLSLQGHEGGVKSVAVSKDGTCLASGGKDKTLRVWDSKSGKELWASAASTGHSRYLAVLY